MITGMDRTPLDSSHLSSVGYDRDARVLTVEFKDGSVHEYEGVPAEDYESLLLAKSHGGHFRNTIKGRYRSRRIS